ncbi:uncharacterized protein LOC105196573 [Solenopsis invicta]|uniref:uncharacterized protein LOC105196573 n=1 Tax=Solenopsis invicta TaxID=13686 RepID=UPI000595E742|nr:uncharacterized protein LOC105196573 [Solenopsis invicta]
MAGGFKLQKWISNHSSVIDCIPEDNRIKATTININSDFTVYTLGLCWQPAMDSFQFSVNIPKPASITKRTILSNIAKLFEKLRTLKLGWDDPLPDPVRRRWLNFTESLDDLHHLSFLRWVHYHSSYSTEVHGFCDASHQAIAAVVYIRTVNTQRDVQTALLASKTKIAPLKKLTIPRLELSGACLLTKLVSHFLNVFAFNNDILPQASWRFVPGTENPADLAIRGLTPTQLSELPIWWTGRIGYYKNRQNGQL